MKRSYIIMVKDPLNPTAFVGGIEYHCYKYSIEDMDLHVVLRADVFKEVHSWVQVKRPAQALKFHSVNDALKAEAALQRAFGAKLNVEFKHSTMKSSDKPSGYAVYKDRCGYLEDYTDVDIWGGYSNRTLIFAEKTMARIVAKSLGGRVMPIWK